MKFRELNAKIKNGSIVFFGSKFFSSMPASELAKMYGLDEEIYNRSIENLNMDIVSSYLNTCVLELMPAKVFLNLGDSDIENGSFNLDSFISKYEWLLYTINTKTKAKMYIIPVMSSSPIAASVNTELEKLAKKYNCSFIDITPALSTEKPLLKSFEILKPYLRTHPINFADAMDAGNNYYFSNGTGMDSQSLAGTPVFS